MDKIRIYEKKRFSRRENFWVKFTSQKIIFSFESFEKISKAKFEKYFWLSVRTTKIIQGVSSSSTCDKRSSVNSSRRSEKSNFWRRSPSKDSINSLRRRKKYFWKFSFSLRIEIFGLEKDLFELDWSRIEPRSLGTLATNATGELDVLGHNGDSLGVDGAQVCVLEKPNEVSLGSFL